MGSEVFEIRYPDGDFEIAATQVHGLPVAGDQFRRKDRLWRVTHTQGRRPVLVHVELVEHRPGNGAAERYESLDPDVPAP
jgi:hypothetical protein